MIAGVDYSTRAVDVVLLEEDTDRAVWHRFELRGQDGFERARDVARVVPGRAMSFWDEVVAVGIEEPRGWNPAKKRPMPSPDLSRIQGAILACIPPSRLVQPWLPAEWRKAVGLPGNATKDTVRRYLLTGLSILQAKETYQWPQDACDAYAIALATRQQLHRTEVA